MTLLLLDFSGPPGLVRHGSLPQNPSFFLKPHIFSLENRKDSVPRPQGGGEAGARGPDGGSRWGERA